jgi:hypothetical protein
MSRYSSCGTLEIAQYIAIANNHKCNPQMPFQREDSRSYLVASETYLVFLQGVLIDWQPWRQFPFQFSVWTMRVQRTVYRWGGRIFQDPAKITLNSFASLIVAIQSIKLIYGNGTFEQTTKCCKWIWPHHQTEKVWNLQSEIWNKTIMGHNLHSMNR